MKELSRVWSYVIIGLIADRDEQGNTMRNNSLKTLSVLGLVLGLACCASVAKEKVVDNESDAEYLFKKATVAMNYGLPKQAVQYAEKTLELDPNHHKAQNLLGLAYIQLENLPAAAAALERCAEINPDFPDAHLNLGAIYEKLNRTDEAVGSYRRAFELGDSVEAAVNLARLLFNEEKPEEALVYINKAAEKDQTVAVFNLKGVILNKMERYSEAIEAFDRAIRISPKDIVTRMNLGIALVNTGNYDRARQVFEYILPYVQDQVLKDRINRYLELIKNRLLS
jgi:tetratricopeptide (TPR) repeat protein